MLIFSFSAPVHRSQKQQTRFGVFSQGDHQAYASTIAQILKQIPPCADYSLSMPSDVQKE